jgi:hypothetical protein
LHLSLSVPVGFFRAGGQRFPASFLSTLDSTWRSSGVRLWRGAEHDSKHLVTALRCLFGAIVV